MHARGNFLDSCRNLVDAARGSNIEIERIFDDTAKALEQAIRTESLGDIDGNASARRELEAAIGQPGASFVGIEVDGRYIRIYGDDTA